jgi:hypothetical protein
MQQDIWHLGAAMGPVTVPSTRNHEIVHRNITACISLSYLLLTGYVDIEKCKTGNLTL